MPLQKPCGRLPFGEDRLVAYLNIGPSPFVMRTARRRAIRSFACRIAGQAFRRLVVSNWAKKNPDRLPTRVNHARCSRDAFTSRQQSMVLPGVAPHGSSYCLSECWPAIPTPRCRHLGKKEPGSFADPGEPHSLFRATLLRHVNRTWSSHGLPGTTLERKVARNATAHIVCMISAPPFQSLRRKRTIELLFLCRQAHQALCCTASAGKMPVHLEVSRSLGVVNTSRQKP